MSGALGLDPRLRVPVYAASAAAALLVVGLTAGAGLAWVHAGTLAALLVLLPVLSVAQLRVLDSVEIERIPAYISSALTLMVLAAWSWFAASGRLGSPGPGLGLRPLPLSAFLGWTLVLTASGLGVMAGFRQIAMGLRLAEARLLRELLPRTPGERAWFVVLSLCAGVGEEMAFRGYAIPVIATVTGMPVAAVITSLVFGVLHAYQGPLGMVRTAVLGGLLAWGFLASGSLLPAIAAHALLDVVAGVFLGERLMVPDADGGVPSAGAADKPG